VVGVFMRAVLGDLRRRARAAGVDGGRSGSVVVLQRFGAALNLNVHVHALVLDGAFAEDAGGVLRFHALPAPSDAEMEAVLCLTVRRLTGLLVRRGMSGAVDNVETEDPWRDEAAGLSGVAAASVQGRAALGARAGARTRRLGGSPELLALWTPPRLACHARQDGYDLQAGVVVPAHDRARLERVCRYALRPPVAADRVRLVEGGDVVLTLRHRWADGTTHLRFDPIELLERLAALTPRPRINLVLYYGVLAAHAAWRARLREEEGEGGDASVRPTLAAAAETGATAVRVQSALGAADAAQLWLRPAGVHVLRRSDASAGADRDSRGHSPPPRAPRIADRGADAASVARAAAPTRGR
jgi:hypothetical protein